MSSISENVDDTLSSLPEDIRSYILSLMPTKFAVQTSILSKIWRYTWTLVTNLDFDDTRRYPFRGLNGLRKLVDEVMKNCKSSQVNLFRLHLYDERYLVLKSSVSSWIDQAVRLKVRELDIRIPLLELPLSVVTCKTLTKLRLMCDAVDWECPSCVNLPCVKTLDIVVYRNPFVNAFKIICGCPMVENLSLKVTWPNNDKEDYIFDIPTLKLLRLTFSPLFNKVVLRVPNLEYLYFGGILCSFFVMEDVSSLVKTSLSLHHLKFDHLWAKLLKGISQVKSLSTCNLPSTLFLPIFPNMKHLELRSSWQFGQILQFLESCPQLKHLYIEKFVKSDWTKPESVPACMLTNLATIKLSKCKRKKVGYGVSRIHAGKCKGFKDVNNHLGKLLHRKRKVVACMVACASKGFQGLRDQCYGLLVSFYSFYQ